MVKVVVELLSVEIRRNGRYPRRLLGPRLGRVEERILGRGRRQIGMVMPEGASAQFGRYPFELISLHL